MVVNIIYSAGLAYMAEVAHATGPVHLGKIIFCARVNCGIASWIVFTTAILHWNNRLQHIRGNIRSVVAAVIRGHTRMLSANFGRSQGIRRMLSAFTENI